MQPTNQTVIPVVLWSAAVGSGASSVELDPSYDHVITYIGYVSSGVPSGGGFISLEDEDSNSFWGQVFPDEDGGVSFVQANVEIVLQSQSSLNLYASVGSGRIYVSGYRLNPSAATIFGT